VVHQGQCFAERPQTGRQRQFHQLGVEVLGCRSRADAEVMIATDILQNLGLRNLRLDLNSVKSRRPAALPPSTGRTTKPYKDELDLDSQSRLGPPILYEF